MNKVKSYLFNKLFPQEKESLEKYRNAVKLLNEKVQEQKIELKEKDSRYANCAGELARMKMLPEKLRNELRMKDVEVTQSTIYQTLLDKYHKIIKENEELKKKINLI